MSDNFAEDKKKVQYKQDPIAQQPIQKPDFFKKYKYFILAAVIAVIIIILFILYKRKKSRSSCNIMDDVHVVNE